MNRTQPGPIIILNSGSVGGAAAEIARALQETSTEPVMHLSLEVLLLYISPPPYVLGNRQTEGVSLQPVHDSDPPQTALVRGPVGELLYQAFHQMIATLSKSRFSVVVDHAIDSDWIADDLQARTVGLPISYVDLYSSRSRSAVGAEDHSEIASAFRQPELSLWLERRVHHYVSDGLKIDIGRSTPEEAAWRIRHLPEPHVKEQETLDEETVVSPARIIALNGPTSAGKSSTARAIQELAEQPFLQVGGDLMINRLLDASYFVGGARSEQGWSVSAVEGSDPPENEVLWGSVAVESFRALHRCVADLARMGCNVVMDHGLLDDRVNADFRALTEVVPVFFVGLHASLDVILERRAPRTDYSSDPEFVALYRWWHRQAHAHGIPYDLELDSEKMRPDACAKAILTTTDPREKPVTDTTEV